MNPERIFEVGNILEFTSTTLKSTSNLLDSTSKGRDKPNFY